MDPAAILMILVSCSPDLLVCREATEIDVRYQNLEICREQLPPELGRLSLGSNRAFGKCIEFGATQYRIGESAFWHVSGDGVLIVTADKSEIAAMTLPPSAQLQSARLRTGTPKGTVNVTRYGAGAKNTSSYDVSLPTVHKSNN